MPAPIAQLAQRCTLAPAAADIDHPRRIRAGRGDLRDPPHRGRDGRPKPAALQVLEPADEEQPEREVPDGSAGVFSQTTNLIDVYIGGVLATTSYVGLAPQLAGLYQINVTIPSGLTAGDNSLEIVGPDSDAAEALVPVGSALTSSASSAPQPAVRKLSKSRRVGGAGPRPAQ